MLKSMTGFGRCELTTEEYKISVEMKAVNHRYLDLSIKMQKKFNGKGFYPYEYQLNAREHVVQEMVDANFLDRCMKLFQEIVPIVKIIARLVAALILEILSDTSERENLERDLIQIISSIQSGNVSGVMI